MVLPCYCGYCFGAFFLFDFGLWLIKYESGIVRRKMEMTRNSRGDLFFGTPPFSGRSDFVMFSNTKRIYGINPPPLNDVEINIEGDVVERCVLNPLVKRHRAELKKRLGRLNLENHGGTWFGDKPIEVKVCFHLKWPDSFFIDNHRDNGPDPDQLPHRFTDPTDPVFNVSSLSEVVVDALQGTMTDNKERIMIAGYFKALDYHDASDGFTHIFIRTTDAPSMIDFMKGFDDY